MKTSRKARKYRSQCERGHHKPGPWIEYTRETADPHGFIALSSCQSIEVFYIKKCVRCRKVLRRTNAEHPGSEYYYS